MAALLELAKTPERWRPDADAVLARTSLGDDSLLAHPLGEQRLTYGVVDESAIKHSGISAVAIKPAAIAGSGRRDTGNIANKFKSIFNQDDQQKWRNL